MVIQHDACMLIVLAAGGSVAEVLHVGAFTVWVRVALRCISIRVWVEVQHVGMKKHQQAVA
jgi:hypothetical protein